MKRFASVLIVAFFAVGCVGTSPTYKAQAFKTIPVAVAEMREYAADNTPEPGEVERVNALELSVVEMKKISAPDVTEKFNAVSPRWRFYLNSDGKLTPEDKLIRLATPDAIDSINQKELRRQASARGEMFSP